MRGETETNMDLVLNTVTELEMDIMKRLPLGAYDKIANQCGLDRELVKTTLKNIRLNCGINTKNIEGKRDGLKKDLLATGIDFSKRLKYGMGKKLAAQFGVPSTHIAAAVTSIHKDMKIDKAIMIAKPGIVLSTPTAKPTPKIEATRVFVNHCVDTGLVRSNANAEIVACNTISKLLLHRVPHGGAGMLIGTPTAFCASDRSNNKMFLTDNLKVAHMLDETTEIHPTIVIGSGVHPDQAEIKKHHWTNNNTTNHFDIITDIVDRDTLTFHVVRMAERNPFCKVVLMTSGVMTGSAETKRKCNGLDLNFMASIKMLITKYPYLHFLVMTIGDCGPKHFKIRYFNDGKEIKYDNT